MTSLRDKFIAALTAQGETKVDSKSRKYDVFTRKGYDGFYYVGKSGALRYGSTVSNSYPMSSAFKTRLLGEPAIGPRKAAALVKVHSDDCLCEICIKRSMRGRLGP